MSARKREGVQPTHEWDLLVPLFEWPEQERYEEIRPLMLFDASVAERAAEVGTSASTLYRRLDRFAEEGMEALFGAPTAKRKRLPPAVRRLIVDLKAEYPRFNLNEIANVVRAGEPLASYEVEYDPVGGRSGAGRLLEVGKPILFVTPFVPGQRRLFGLAEALGEDGWLKALRLRDYAPRSPRQPAMLQQVLFPYTDAV